MKKTDMKVCCGKKNGYDVYRIVWTDGAHYFVKWNSELINVDKDIKDHNYSVM